MRAWPIILLLSPLLAAGCVPYAGYYYQPFSVYPAPYAQSAGEPGGECRETSMKATIDGRLEDVVGTVCKGPDGVWHVQPGDGSPDMPAR